MEGLWTRGWRIDAALESVTEAVRELLAEARAVESGKDSAVADRVREGIVRVGRAGQVLHGLLTVLVAEGDRLRIAAGGVGPWLATVLDLTDGGARQLAHDARVLAGAPELEGELCSGRVGAGTVRVLARTVKATRGTELDAVAEAHETLAVVRKSSARGGSGSGTGTWKNTPTPAVSSERHAPSSRSVPSPGSVTMSRGRCAAWKHCSIPNAARSCARRSTRRRPRASGHASTTRPRPCRRMCAPPSRSASPRH